MADTDSVHTARCQCGALTAECRGEPGRVSLCHCHACQRRTGSAFGVQATFDEAQVKLSGEPTTFVRYGEGGHWGRLAFCPTCGTTLWWHIERRPDAVSIALGCFEANEFGPPAFEVYDECAMAGIGLKIFPGPVRQ